MCLLVTQTKDVVFDDDFLKGVYRKNGDGIGIMYAENNTIFVKKFLPKTEKQFIEFYRNEIEGRDCAWHARMRTHGDIDMENCHPYVVISADEGYPLYLAHNGVLHTGNAADKTKSDTWHYIRDYLRPMLLKNPEFFKTEAFSELVGSHIGANKFVLMDAFGNSVTVNEDQGVHHNGAWLSNTYAWDTAGTSFAPKWGSAYKPGSFRGYYNYGTYGAYDDDDYDLHSPLRGTTPQIEKINEEATLEYGDEDCVDWLVSMCDALEKNHFDVDQFPWAVLENYYYKVGEQLAWEILEWVDGGYYTQEDLLKEVLEYADDVELEAA